MRYPNINPGGERFEEIFVDKNTLMVDKNNNRVGILTSTPAYTLDVAGTIRIQGAYELIFPDGSSMNSAATGSASTVSNNGDISLIADATALDVGDVLFKIASKNYVSLKNNGDFILTTTTTGVTHASIPLYIRSNFFNGIDYTNEAKFVMYSAADPYLRISISNTGANPVTTDVVDIKDDTIQPITNNVVSLGTGVLKFKNSYFAGAINAGSLVLSGTITGATSISASSLNLTGNITSVTNIVASGAISGASLALTGAITSVTTIDASNNITTTADISADAIYANGHLNINGGLTINTVTKVNDYIINTFADSIVLIDATANNIAISLPDATGIGMIGVTYTFKRIDNIVSNSVTITPALTQTIDGSVNKLLSSQYSTLTILCDGANWLVISSL